MLTEEKQTNFDSFWEIAHTYIKDNGDIHPVVLMPFPDGRLGIIEIVGAKNGKEIVFALKMAVEKINPEYYILHLTGWAASDKAYTHDVLSGRFESISDMPMDDKKEILFQIMVNRTGEIEKKAMDIIRRVNDTVEFEPKDMDEIIAAECRLAIEW